MILDEKQQVKTADLGFAATLVSLGYPIIDLEKTTSRRVYFCFYEPPAFIEIENNYWSKNLAVDAYTLGQNIKLLKNRLHAGLV